MALWYYGSQGTQNGPVEDDELRALIAAGTVNAATMVWKDGMEDWLPVCEVAELSGQMVPTPGASPYQTPGTGYQTPGVGGYQVQSMPRANGLAIASMVCGITGMLLMCMYMGGPLGLAAVICGHIGMGQISRSALDPMPQGGRGMAIAGLILGYIAIVLQVVMVVFLAIAFTSASSAP